MQLNAIKQLDYFMHPETRRTIVQSFILAHFNYCSITWYFSSAKQINQKEKLQENFSDAFQMIITLNSLQLIENNKFVSMEIKRKQTLCTETFKTLNDLNPQYMKDFFQKKNFFLQPQVI